MTDQRELAGLIKQAQKEAQAHAHHIAPAKHHAIPWGLIFSAVLAILTFYAIFRLAGYLMPPSQQRISQDMVSLIKETQKLVENSKKETGELPKSLPHAALASVVNYEVRDKEYKLSGTVSGVRVTLDWDQTLKTETDQ